MYPLDASSLQGNTSSVPLFDASGKAPSPDRDRFPLFWKDAVPDSMEAVLEEGDMLVMGPGWWHAMRQEGGPGWGLSFWF